MTENPGVLGFPTPPIRLWTAHGYNVVDSERRVGTIAEGSNSGYDVIDVEAHGGLTYGPDEQGWVGFDTMHAWDHWDQEIVREHLLPVDPDLYYRGQEVRLIIGHLLDGPRVGNWDIDWTMERLITEVEDLALRLRERSGLSEQPPARTSPDE